MEEDHQIHQENLLSEKSAKSDGNAASQSLQQAQRRKKITLLAVNVVFLLIGGVGSPLILRAYFLYGGSRKWFSTLIQTVGFPFLIIPLVFSFFRRRGASRSLTSLSPCLLINCIILGIITGAGDFLYSIGISLLPVSTSSLLASMELGFTAVFAYFIMRQKFTHTSVNSVVLLIFGAAMLSLHVSGVIPAEESRSKYYLGFLMTLGSAMVYGLVLPLVELIYKHAKQEVTYALILEMQIVMGLSASAFTAVGMVINRDFQAISREAEQYELGPTKYYLVIVFSAIMAQIYFLGLVGVIKYSSALLSGVVNALCIPITEALAVFLFHEKISGNKVIAVLISLWGTASYFYGEYKDHKGSKAAAIATETQLSVSIDSFKPITN